MSWVRPYSASPVRLLLTFALLLLSSRALAEGAPAQGEVVQPEDDAIMLYEPGTVLRYTPPPAPGSCIGGSCAVGTQSQVQPIPAAPQQERPVDRRERFAYAGVGLGVASAALVLGGAIAIAKVDDLDSERITRGVWLGTMGLTTPLVALSAHLARKRVGHDGDIAKGARTLGWIAYTLAMADGVVLWVGAFHRFGKLDALTIGAGAIGACALLPHALDAFVSARSLTSRRITRLEPTANGLRVRF